MWIILNGAWGRRVDWTAVWQGLAKEFFEYSNRTNIQLEGKEFIDKLTVCQFAKKPIKIHGVS
jgi:hypothetical protein